MAILLWKNQKTAGLSQGRVVVCPRDGVLFFSDKKKVFFSVKGGGNSVNEGFGEGLYKKGISVKRFGPFSEPPDSEN